jgi:pSer/pThr/pTyr-binding forkhead associated (FHA) protein
LKLVFVIMMEPIRMKVPRLQITSSSGPARTVELADITMLGRDSQNDIVLDEAMISRCHAMLLAKPQGIVLIDLGSTNGTLVNGAFVLPDMPVTLEDGDTIALGRVIARYSEGDCNG